MHYTSKDLSTPVFRKIIFSDVFLGEKSYKANGSLRYMTINNFDLLTKSDWVNIAPTDNAHTIILSIHDKLTELA